MLSLRLMRCNLVSAKTCKAYLTAHTNKQEPLDIQSLHSCKSVEIGRQCRLHAPCFEDILFAACYKLYRALETSIQKIAYAVQ